MKDLGVIYVPLNWICVSQLKMVHLQIICNLSAYSYKMFSLQLCALFLPNNREKEEQYADIRDLVTSFSALEEKVLENYTYAKVRASCSFYCDLVLRSFIQFKNMVLCFLNAMDQSNERKISL